MSAEKDAENGVDQETGRGRIRRLLFDPLEGDGFRKSAKVSADRHKDAMARLADDICYLSDDGVERLRLMLRTKGEGKSRDVWPSVATILGWAELIEARPLRELPRLLSWFASIEGPRAAREGVLVESYLFFRDRKRPPIQPGGSYPMIIVDRARENQSRLRRCKERVANGRATADDRSFVEWYEGVQKYCNGLISGGAA